MSVSSWLCRNMAGREESETKDPNGTVAGAALQEGKIQTMSEAGFSRKPEPKSLIYTCLADFLEQDPRE